MKVTSSLKDDLWIKFLSLLLAVILWVFVAGERQSELTLTTPLEFRNLSPELEVVGLPRQNIEIRVAGPKILLLQLQDERLSIPLEMQQLKEGVVVFSGLERSIQLPEGVRITRVYPSSIEARLVKKIRTK